MKHKYKSLSGFTLLELLIVIAIIALLMTVGVILLGTARERARDAKRLSDLDHIRVALEQYFYNNNKYPQAPTAIELGTTGYRVLCAGSVTGFTDTRESCGGTVYLEPIPRAPEPGPAAVAGYQYVSLAPFSTYRVTAALEGSLDGLSGVLEVSPSGMKQK